MKPMASTVTGPTEEGVNEWLAAFGGMQPNSATTSIM